MNTSLPPNSTKTHSSTMRSAQPASSQPTPSNSVTRPFQHHSRPWRPRTLPRAHLQAHQQARLHRTTGTPVAYQLVPHPTQPLPAHASLFHTARSGFAARAAWGTQYAEGAVRHGHTRHAVSRREGRCVVDPAAGGRGQGDGGAGRGYHSVVRVWHTHNPRAEDWQVMPCKKMVVFLNGIRGWMCGL